jgi:glycosyltransferase involved in cell wall biosynthesis
MISSPYGGNRVHFQRVVDVLGRRADIELVEPVFLEYEPLGSAARLPFRLSWVLASWVAVRRTLRRSHEECADVVLMNFVNPLVLLDRTLRRQKMVLWLDATPSQVGRMGGYRRRRRPSLVRAPKHRLYRRAFARAAHVASVSRLTQQSVVDEYGVDARSTSVIPYGVDLARWSRLAERADSTRVLFVGGDFERKGGAALLALAEACPTYAFDLVTTIPASAHLPPNVSVHEGLGPDDPALLRLYATASIFVLPTLADFSPIAVCEAMAMHLPVVAADVGAMAELVCDGETGHLVPAGDTTALLDRVRRLAESPALLTEMGARGRQHVEQHHDLAALSDTIVGLLHELTGRPHRS